MGGTELYGDGDVGNGDALNVEHRDVCGDGVRLHGSTTGTVLLFAITPR